MVDGLALPVVVPIGYLEVLAELAMVGKADMDHIPPMDRWGTLFNPLLPMVEQAVVAVLVDKEILLAAMAAIVVMGQLHSVQPILVLLLLYLA
jgi:hypothetical protein